VVKLTLALKHNLWQAVNVDYACHYFVPAHTGIAKIMKVRDDLIEELRNDDTLSDSKLNTLRKPN